MAFSGQLDFDKDEKKVDEQLRMVAMTFNRYKEIQLGGATDYREFHQAKEELQQRLDELNHDLNILLHKQTSGLDYKIWLNTHQPFHWLAEFYEIIHDRGGFDVIIGNPPYVNFKNINYNLEHCFYNCISCKDLFALTVERSFNLNSSKGRNGFIIPLSGFSTEVMIPLRYVVFNNSQKSWNSYYSASDQPAALFSGVRHRLLITINQLNVGNDKKFYSTNFLKWFSIERDFLFTKAIYYSDLSGISYNSKISGKVEKNILKRVLSNKVILNFTSNTGSPVYYHNAPVHWGKVFDFVPFFSVNKKQKQSSHIKDISFDNYEYAAIIICALNSSFFYWFNWQYSNCRDLSKKDIYRFPLSLNSMNNKNRKELMALKDILMKDFKQNSKVYKRISKNILTEFDSFYPMLSKPIIDQIDTVLADHYGFTPEELDFIINYDIKYRMGKELEGDEGE